MPHADARGVGGGRKLRHEALCSCISGVGCPLLELAVFRQGVAGNISGRLTRYWASCFAINCSSDVRSSF